VAVSCLAVLASGALGPVDAQQPQALVIQGGTLIDGNGGALVEQGAHPGAVLVHHGVVA
jgi:hypothetical protein